MKVQNSFAKRASKWSAFVLVPGLVVFLVIFLLHLLILSANPMSAIAGLGVSGLGTYWFGTSLYLKYKGGDPARPRPSRWAVDETSITLSPSVSFQTIRRASIGVGVGLIVGVWIADLSPLATIGMVVAIVACIALVIRVSSAHPWLHLSTSGMRGQNESGDPAWIPWTDEVSIRRSDASTAVWEMTVIESPASGEILIPSALLKEAQFKEVVKRLAPQGHPLTTAGSLSRFRR